MEAILCPASQGRQPDQIQFLSASVGRPQSSSGGSPIWSPSLSYSQTVWWQAGCQWPVGLTLSSMGPEPLYIAPRPSRLPWPSAQRHSGTPQGPLTMGCTVHLGFRAATSGTAGVATWVSRALVSCSHSLVFALAWVHTSCSRVTF